MGQKKIQVQYRGFIGIFSNQGFYRFFFQYRPRGFIGVVTKNTGVDLRWTPGVFVFWPINPRHWTWIFCPHWFWTYPDGAQGVGDAALRLAAACPCDLRVPEDCVAAEWQFMSREQKNCSQDPPTWKARSNICSKKKFRPQTKVSLRTSQETERVWDSWL